MFAPPKWQKERNQAPGAGLHRAAAGRGLAGFIYRAKSATGGAPAWGGGARPGGRSVSEHTAAFNLLEHGAEVVSVPLGELDIRFNRPPVQILFLGYLGGPFGEGLG